jgi:nucleoid DNA-binding protein
LSEEAGSLKTPSGLGKVVKKAEMIQRLSTETNMLKKDVERFINAYERELFTILLNGGVYYIRSVGKLRVVKAKEQRYDHDINGHVYIPERYTVTFKRSEIIYEALKKYIITKNDEQEGEDEFAIFE